MKKFNFQSIGDAKRMMKALPFFAFFAMLLLMSSVEVNAQTSASGGILREKHPATNFAKAIGVTVAPLGSWDVNKVIPVLNQRLNSLDPNSTDLFVRFKLIYFSKVLSDVSKYDISPEISTLLTMSEVSSKFNNPAITVSMMKALYISTTNTF